VLEQINGYQEAANPYKFFLLAVVFDSDIRLAFLGENFEREVLEV
jgi:hypothetical protein